MNLYLYVSVAYQQDGKVIGLATFDDTCGEHARLVSIELLPPQHILDSAGITSVTLVTRILTPETWPKCHREGCEKKACLHERSPWCYEHLVEMKCKAR